MLIVTTHTVEGYNIIETKGLVRGTSCRSKNIGKDILSSFKNVVGGEMHEYTDMLNEARKFAIQRMVDDATSQGANAIVGVSMVSAAISQGVSEITVFGTGVVIEKLDD